MHVQVDAISLLCGLGANPQTQSQNDLTALLCCRDKPAVTALLDAGAVADFETRNGTTALIEFARDGKASSGFGICDRLVQVHMLEILVGAGAHVDFETSTGRVAIVDAAYNGL